MAEQLTERERRTDDLAEGPVLPDWRAVLREELDRRDRPRTRPVVTGAHGRRLDSFARFSRLPHAAKPEPRERSAPYSGVVHRAGQRVRGDAPDRRQGLVLVAAGRSSDRPDVADVAHSLVQPLDVERDDRLGNALVQGGVGHAQQLLLRHPGVAAHATFPVPGLPDVFHRALDGAVHGLEQRDLRRVVVAGLDDRRLHGPEARVAGRSSRGVNQCADRTTELPARGSPVPGATGSRPPAALCGARPLDPRWGALLRAVAPSQVGV